ncbi:MAG TPA: hypothetical protein VJQ43_00905, partial [Thermoplasmata archaeon]|nr:hypothetical protein [Thermoplasmata archaeon]
LLFVFALLLTLVVRSAIQFRQTRSKDQIIWGSGLALAAAAMAVEAIVYWGVPPAPYLPAYVFLSAAIVGVLSLGATRVLRSPRLELAYRAWILGTCALVGALCAVTPLPESMVTAGVITGNPPLSLLLASTLVTGPATVVLLGASYLSLRRTWRWHTVLMIAGALILGAGGVLYIATFPVALYYAEFVGVLLLFLGLVSLPTTHATPRRTGIPATP